MNRQEIEEQIRQIDKEIAALNTEQMSIKILMNSLFGAMGNPWFSLYSLKTAIAITLTGQLVNKWGTRDANKWINDLVETDDVDYAIAADTDSTYIDVEPIVQKFKPKNPIDFLDRVGKDGIEKAYATSMSNLADITSAYKNTMVWDRECIASRGIWTAKKRYILNVWDDEGTRYSEPKLKIMGVEAIKSSTPKWCRDRMVELFKVMLEEDESSTQAAISKIKKEFKKIPVDKIASPRGVNEIKKYLNHSKHGKPYIGGTPMNSRSAILHNMIVKDKDLKHVPELKAGTKIKFVPLKMPNPIGENVIGFGDVLPTEFGLDLYIDKEKQFNKAFLEPIELVLNAIGWEAEERATLDELFGF